MLRKEEQLNIGNGKTVTALVAHGQMDLERCFNELNKPAVEKSEWSPLFFVKPRVDESSSKEHVIFYTNGPRQRSLIVVSGEQCYFYDLIKGAAASYDVKNALGDKLIDVSGEESRQNLQKTNYELSRARELSVNNLPDLTTAIAYAYKQIEVAQNKSAKKSASPTVGRESGA